MIVVICGLLGTAAILLIGTEKMQKIPFTISLNNSFKQSKWPKNTLVVIPAIWKEIDWSNRTNWPSWLREGLGWSNTNPRSYYIHLYQRMDPNSTIPYDWPYCPNVHEETGIYLQFIRDYYHDLPDKMLFIHGNPFIHTSYNPIQSALCVRDNVHFASVNDVREWIQKRPWTYWPQDPDDKVALMYKCAKRILTLLGYEAELILNPTSKTPKDENVISGFCCAQFYVTKQRIHHYTYEQWLSLYDANFEPFCTTPRENEQLGKGIQWFGGTLEHTWHVILGLYPVDAPAPLIKTEIDRCQWFRPSCKGSPCTRE
ncbi:unnamed protein product [Rotaria sp. Silwood2]|nr:unnamed protein product [Rotaria sp. Silwood2]CAF4478731.1 unnamed protein product [Rotaria sp. Silwood2]